MARVSFTLRRPSTDADLGSYLRYDDALGARTDYDSALRADGLQTAPSTFATSSFSATSVCYGEVELEWEVPLVAVEDLTATPEPTDVVLVYSSEGEPATIASGTILVESTDTFAYSHHGLMEGRWAYYSLFVHYQSTGGDSYYEKVAALSVIVPKDYGSTAQLWKRIPEYYRNQDTMIGDLDYDAACLGSVITSSTQTVGPLLKFLAVFGYEIDRMRTLLDYQMVAYDPALANSEHLDALSEQLGVDMLSSALGSRRLRTLLNDIGVFRRSKGTASSVEFFGQAIAGSDVSIDQATGEVIVYSQRVNYITDPVDGESVTTTRPATVLEETAPQAFSNDYPSWYLKNLGTGGSALDARFGSTVPSSYFNGTAMVLPGVAGNYASTPDAAALDITGAVELVGRATGVPASDGYLALKGASYATRAYSAVLRSTGALGFWSRDTALAAKDLNSSAVLPYGAVTPFWWKITADPVSGNVNFYHAADQATEPSSWTQLGTTQSATWAGTAFTTNADALLLGNTLAATLYRTIVRNGIGGTTVFDADFAKPYNTTSFTATTGQTVTLTRSVSGTDTNDPTLLPHTGTNYLYLPGTTSNNASIPDAAALDITGDIEIVCRTALDDWTPSGTQTHVARQTLVDPNRGWTFNTVNTSGALQLAWWPTGSAASNISKVSTANLPGVDGTTYWIKATLDVDNGASGNTVRFYYAADQETEPTSWTQLGADVVTAGVTSLPNITSPLYAGFTDGTTSYSGKLYRTIVRNGIGGSTVVDIDFTTGITSGGQASFTCTTGQTVTINRATSGRKAVAVTRPIILLGADDYLVVSDNPLINFAAGESFTVVGVHRIFGSGSSTSLISKRQSAGGAWWSLYRNTAGTQQVVSRINDGTLDTNISSVAAPAAGTLVTAVMVRDVTSDTLKGYVNSGTVDNSGTDTTTGTLSNTGGLYIGSNGVAVPTYFDGEFVAAAVFRRALTAAEVALVNTHYNTAPTPESMALLAEAVFWVDAGLSSVATTLGTYSTFGNEYTLLPLGTTTGATHALFHISDPIPIQLSDRVGFSVQSNVGTDGIQWVRLVNSAGASVGLQDTALTVDGARIFEVTAESNASVGVWTDVYVEYLVDLSAVSTFTNGALLAERNFLGTYFDGSTVRGGWLVDSSSVSDYRWESTANASRSLFTEDYQRTKAVVQDLFYDTLPITEVSKYTIVAYNAVPGVPLGL